MRAVTAAELAAFTSPYLADGYKRDQLLLEEASFGKAGITGTFAVGDHFIPSDGEFHFTLLLAFVAVAQLAIVFAHLDSGLDIRHGEVLLTHLDLRCTRLITDTEGLSISLEPTGKKSLGHAALYAGRIDVCDGSFAGEGEFYFPLPQERSRDA